MDIKDGRLHGWETLMCTDWEKRVRQCKEGQFHEQPKTKHGGLIYEGKKGSAKAARRMGGARGLTPVEPNMRIPAMTARRMGMAIALNRVEESSTRERARWHNSRRKVGQK